MEILLTNDDGINAPGIWALYRELSPRHTVTVVAPERERSAVSHAITLHKPLRAEILTVPEGGRGYAVSGTPADCVKLAVLEIFREKPALAISGINPGANVGVNVNYSGTVSAAREAALYGIPAIAVSIAGKGDCHYASAARFTAFLAETVLARGLPCGTFLNVNLPNLPLERIAGVRISRQGLGMFPEYFEKRTDPRNRTYYWQGCDFPSFTPEADMDGAALSGNQIAVTPIRCDTTDYQALDTLRDWRLDTHLHPS